MALGVVVEYKVHNVAVGGGLSAPTRGRIIYLNNMLLNTKRTMWWWVAG